MSSQSSLPSSPATSMYAASVNPPRKAKLQAAASLLPTLLPSPPSSDSSPATFSVSNVVSSPEPVQPRKKRGRKPAAGGSSRAAREAARKANHSRIEKARRGKINTALQELKRLVPPEFAPAKDEEEEEDDDEDAAFTPTGPSKKESGKKGSSEREFKLDILERTVLFVRALLKRVDETGQQENPEGFNVSSDCNCKCHSSSSGEQRSKKRKSIEQEETVQRKKRRPESHEVEERDHVSDIDDDDSETVSCEDTDDDNDATEDAEITTLSPNERTNRIRLPSISELLSSPIEVASSLVHGQQLPSPSLSPQASPHHHGYQSRILSNLSSPVTPLTTALISAESEDASRLCKARASPTDSRASYPVGMSYLLTPSSPNTLSASNVHTPAFRLPSSALDTRDASEERVTKPSLQAGVDADDRDGGARTATLALLQMRRSSFTSHSRTSAQPSITTTEKGKEKAKPGTALTSPTTRTGLTPGGILGIQTNI